MEQHYFWMKFKTPCPTCPKTGTEATVGNASRAAVALVESPALPMPPFETRGATIRARAETPRKAISFNLLGIYAPKTAASGEVSFYIEYQGATARAFTKGEAEKAKTNGEIEKWLGEGEVAVLVSLDVQI